MQAHNINRFGVVHAGATLKEASIDAYNDICSVDSNTVVLMGYRIRDRDLANLSKSKANQDRVIDNIIASGDRAKVDLLKIPLPS